MGEITMRTVMVEMNGTTIYEKRLGAVSIFDWFHSHQSAVYSFECLQLSSLRCISSISSWDEFVGFAIGYGIGSDNFEFANKSAYR